MKRSVILSTPTARRTAHQYIDESPDETVVTFAPKKRTLPQNAHIHPVIERLADALKRPKDEESLRKLRWLLLEQWRHETGRNPLFERSMDGMRWVSVDKGTSDLDKPDCSEFIDWLIAEEAQVCG